ncbi:MAG: preprotein translocase subunit SecG [Elusimicrobiota bacterium]
MYGFILTIHIIVSVGLILIVLLQAGRGAGISGLFGGGGETGFGGPTTPVVIKKITATMAAVFMITALFLTVIASKKRSRSLAERIPPAPAQTQQQQPAPPENAPATPSVPTQP